MRNGQLDIAITTAEHIATMLEEDTAEPHDGAIRLVRAFIHALRLTAPTARRPRKPRTPKTAPETLTQG